MKEKMVVYCFNYQSGNITDAMPAGLPTGQTYDQILRCALILHTCIVLVLSDKYCPPITLGKGSPLFPQRTKGGNITMYRTLHTNTNPHLLKVTWDRAPYSLSHSTGRYIIDNVVSNGTVRTNISLWGLKLVPDIGSYTVSVCSNCTCNTTTFVLELYKCDPSDMPEPVQQYSKAVMSESFFSKVLNLYVLFHGSTDGFLYMTNWKHNGNESCMEDTTEDQFSCNRTVYGDCQFTANLYIFNASSKYSGNYTVQVIGGTGASRNATIHIDILGEPEIRSCENLSSHTDHSGHAQFMCHLSNYSEYTEVMVVKGNKTVYNASTKEISFACQSNNTDTSLAVCTVNISTTLHSGSLQYKLCVGLNASVEHHTGLHCSDDITISVSGNSTDSWSHLTIGLVVGGGVLLLVLVMLLFVVVGVTVHRRRRRRLVFVGLNESSPLLQPGDTSHAHRISSTATPLWKTVDGGALQKDDLEHIATVIDTRWPVLAHHLGVSNTLIAAIEQRYSSNCKEQSFQMLLKWFQEKPTQPTRQGLVQIIEENMQDPALAQDVVSMLGSK